MKAPLYLLLALGMLAPLATMTGCTYSQVLNRQESALARLNRSLAAVHDRASAQAAIPAVNRYGRVLSEDLNTLFANGKPTWLELLMLKNSYQNSNISSEAKTSLREIFRIAQANFYGCTELRNAMISAVLNQIRGRSGYGTPTQGYPVRGPQNPILPSLLRR